ncbi:unnamed protein product [Litomosoides sigmodontis]|uniref:Uncharacterized protein n=1 Tax=Litomosoides sigmodontis TaxID=42156 RepID=A0A3P6SZT4_LITSI|nr:unnamed protein product [Litomosoides sigmodontis]
MYCCDICYYLSTDVRKYFLEKKAEKLRGKTGSLSEHRREYMDRVQEEPIEMNQFCGDYDDEKIFKSERIASNCDHNPTSVVHKKLSGQYSDVCCEQQQHGISETTSSSVCSVLSTENVAVMSGNVDGGDSDDDENDEFYDASSDFNDAPLSSPAASTLVDTDTDNIISSAVALQNDSREKIILNGSSLAAVSECVEPSVEYIANNINLLSSNGSRYETRQIRQVNTARVPPMIAQNVRSSFLDKSKSPHGLAKSQSPSTQPDLKDIKSIVERQEAELRQELSRLKSSVQGEITSKTLPSNARKSQVQSTRSGTISLASSRSIEFSANGAKLSAVTCSSPIFHTSRLPTPVRKSHGRSLIPTPRASTLSKSYFFKDPAIRDITGGSTPSLVLSPQHVYDGTHSECGGISHNEQRWSDECF